METSPRNPDTAAEPIQRPSALISRMIAALIVLGALLVALGAGAVWGVRHAAVDIIKAEQSFHQLGNAHAIEAAFNRYLLREIARRLDSDGDPAESIEAARLRGALYAYRRAIAEEIATSADEVERQQERGELVRANAIASLFETIETEAMHDRIAPASFGAIDHARGFLSRIAEYRDQNVQALLLEVKLDERQEAEAAFERLEALKSLLFGVGGGLSAAFMTGAIIYGWLFYGRLLAPIKKLTLAAEGLGSLDANARAPTDLPREFWPLVDRFNAMAERIGTERARLEAQVARRTEALETANAELKRIDDSRRSFFANISHELRTPVTVLLGEAQVALRRRDDPSSMAEALDRIAATSAFLGRRLDDLMKLARSEDGRLTLTRAPMDLSEAVGDAVALASSYALANDVRLDFQQTGPAPIDGDAEALRQAALVLIDNAVKVSPIGGVITIDVAQEERRATLRIVDQGPGFDQSEPEQLFERYAQGSAGRGRGGSGLGLSIAHWIVGQHNGSLRAFNAPDGGAVLELEIPR